LNVVLVKPWVLMRKSAISREVSERSAPPRRVTTRMLRAASCASTVAGTAFRPPRMTTLVVPAATRASTLSCGRVPPEVRMTGCLPL
jgi:hypothetical protein